MSKRDLDRTRQSLEETLPPSKFTFVPGDIICQKCLFAFANRRYNSCRHPKHKGNRTREQRRLHFVTALETQTIYKVLNLKPNDALCDSCRASDRQSEEPPRKKMLLDDLNALQRMVSPSTSAVKFEKRNTVGKTNLINKVVTSIQENIVSRCESAGFPVNKTREAVSQSSEDLDWIMENLKTRMNGATNAEKKSFLTIVPPSWTISKTMDYFEVSKRLVIASRKRFKETNSILPPVLPKPGRKLSEDTKSLVNDFYYDDEISRASPGQQDVLSIKNEATGKREKKQKRYLLNNLSELYQIFKTRHPETKLGLSTFLILRPKECLSLNTKGFHNVCVCIYHQNVKLLFNAIGEKSIKPWIQLLICSEARKDCFYRRCLECQDFKTQLTAKLLVDNSKIDTQPIIRFRRWTATDGTNFITDEKPALEFLDFICDELEVLLKHHYVTNNQQQYLNNLKRTMRADEIIVWGDFAENYSPAIQDAIQSEYFSHKQITVHPFTIYWRFNDTIYNAGFCVISDCTLHDTNSFYAFQTELLPLLISQFKTCGITVSHINYFSDGCAAQYKNRKNFVNLAHHRGDFGVTAEWNFFATAHGKGPCDALGGTTKRLA